MNIVAPELRIADFDDPSFDPYATFDKIGGLGDLDDPFPRIHKLAAEGPVKKGDLREEFGLPAFPIWSQFPSYMLFGYETITKAYMNASAFSNGIMQALYADTFGLSINGMDAPEHGRYRALFQQAFMPRTVAQWGAHLVPEVINRVIDRFADRGRADLVSEFTIHYPFDVVYAQLGLPESEAEVFQKLAVGTMCLIADPEHAIEASRKMGVYLQTLLDERRLGDGDDLISLLARAEVQGERLPDEIAVSFLRQLLNAAGDTTYRSTGAMMVGLLTNPDQLAAVTADRSLVPQVVEETLRWDGPLTLLTRQTTKEVVIGGTVIPAGAKIDMVQGSANRDPKRYENPDKFDIFRPLRRNVAFAFGPHICLGQHLARLEMERALNTLLDRLPNLRLDPDYPAPKIVGLNSRAPLEVRVLFDA